MCTNNSNENGLNGRNCWIILDVCKAPFKQLSAYSFNPNLFSEQQLIMKPRFQGLPSEIKFCIIVFRVSAPYVMSSQRLACLITRLVSHLYFGNSTFGLENISWLLLRLSCQQVLWLWLSFFAISGRQCW